MYEYGLTSEQFWGLTPAQFHALSQQHDDGELRQDYRAGVVAQVIANSNRNPKKQKKPFEWSDFFPHWKPLLRLKSIKTPEELLQQWESQVVPKFTNPGAI